MRFRLRLRLRLLFRFYIPFLCSSGTSQKKNDAVPSDITIECSALLVGFTTLKGQYREKLFEIMIWYVSFGLN
jgi:hypothetical protein